MVASVERMSVFEFTNAWVSTLTANLQVHESLRLTFHDAIGITSTNGFVHLFQFH